MFTPRAARRAACALAVFSAAPSFPPLAAAAPLWDITHNPGGSGAAFGVALSTTGSVYTAGHNGADFILLQASTAGSVLSTRTYDSGNSDVAFAVSIDSAGNVYAAGQSFNGANNDMRFVRWTSTGGLALTAAYDGGGTETSLGVAVDAAGAVYLAGSKDSLDSLLVKFTSTGGVSWAKTFDSGTTDSASALALDSAGNAYLTGYSDSGSSDVRTMKYDPDGNLVWNSTYSTAGSERGGGIALDPSGNVYVAGTQGSDFLLLKYSPAGAFQWARTWDSGRNDLGYAVSVDASGTVFAAGTSEEGGSSNNDFRTWRYDSAGNLLTTTLYEDALSNSEGRGIAVDPAGFLYVSGLGSGSSMRLLKDSFSGISLSTAAPSFPDVGQSSLTVQWASTGFPSGTLYYAQLSTNASFAGPTTSSNTFGLSATFAALSSQSTYYAQVATAPAGPFTFLGSTVTLQFVRRQLPGTAGYALRIALGDLDGDGDLDAALAQATTLNETILRNDGGGAFTQVTIAGSGGASSSLAACDLDTDGDLDLLVGNDSNEDEVLYRNDGALAFTKILLTGTGGNTKGVACADYDADGDQDAVIANDLGQSIVLLKNNGGLSFTQVTLPGTGANNRDVKWLDYDSDGDLDVFVAVNGDDGVLRNDGDAGFTKFTLAGSGGDSVRVSLADYDLDGDLDPLLANYSGGRMLLDRSDGAGGFAALPLMSSTGTYDVVWGDYDGDGDADALFGEVNGEDYIARNDGAGVFTRLDLTGSKGNTNSVAWGDFDADGDLDALLGKALTADAVLMANQGSVVNAAPGAPGGVALAFADHPSSAALTVTWSAADYDGGLSTAGLSYALAVATAPMTLSGDSKRVVSPSGFIVTWNYGTPPGGNAQKARHRVWPGEAVPRNGLAHALDLGGILGANFKSDATYYVRLQTVDAGLARSTWSAEESIFVLRSPPPAAAAVVSSTALTVSFSTSGAAAYHLNASTAADFSGDIISVSGSSVAPSLALAGLLPSTTYYLRFGALWQRTTVWAAPSPAAAQTSALSTGLSTGPFSAVSTSALTASWGSTVPGGTLYYAQVSTNASFAAPVLSSNTLNLSASFSGLTPNTTYYAQVATAPAGPFISLGGTATWVQTPTSVYFDDISSHSIVASAYAPTPAFSNLNIGLSGTNIAKDGVYAGWHGEAWTAKASLALARYGLSLAPLDGRLYAMGGYNATIRTDNAEYDPNSNAWTAKASLPVALLAHTALPVDGSLLVSGGAEAGGASTFNRTYSPAENSWTALTPVPPGRAGHGAGINGGLVILFGGANPSLTATVQSYSLSAGTWSAGVSLPTAIQAMGFAQVRGRLYSLGGYTTSYSSAAFEYAPPSASWTTKASMPGPRAWFNSASLGGKIYSLGGQNAASSALSTNEEYDPASDSWATRLALPTPRSRPGVAALGGRIYVAGGVDGAPTSANEVYDPGTATQFTGLSPNTQYSFKAKARNQGGVETDETATVSTYTLAAVPAAATPTFTAVYAGSVTVQWTANGNPGGTEYRLQASTASDFNTAASSGSTAWSTALGATAASLTPYTPWYFRVQARNALGVETAFGGLGSTVTAPAGPPLRVWDGGGITNNASEAANWAGDVAPAVGDSVWFGPASAKDCTWNTVVSLASMTMAAGYEGTVTLSTNVTVGGDLTVSSGTLVAPAGGTVVTILGRIVRNVPSSILWSTGRLRLAGDLVLNAVNTTAVWGSTVEFNGSAYQVVYGTGSGVLPALDVNSSSKVYFNRQGGGVSFTGGVFLRAGVLDLGGQMMFEAYGPWVQTGGQFTAAQSTVIFYGGSAAAPWTVTSLPGNPFFNLRIGALPQAAYPGHLRAAVPLDVDGSVIISSGSFDPGSFTHTVGGDWMHIGGDFLSSTGTIRLDGAAATRVIQPAGASFSGLDAVKSATTTFTAGVTVSSLSFSESGGILSFQAGSTATVGRLLLGTPGLAQRLTLRSTAPGTPWRLIVLSTASVWRTAVSDSDASGGLTVRARLGDSFDGGGNTNWEFDSITPGALSGVSTGALSASWTSTFPGGTVYLLQASTASSFAAPVTSSATAALSATLYGLSANATYFVRVAADPAGPFVSLGSTHTWVHAPTAVYFDEVTTHSLVASAYAPTPAFSNLHAGLSGTNVARDGVYAGWHGERWTSKAAMPTARNHPGAGVVNGRLYAVGGYAAFTYLTTNEEYDPAADSWTAKAGMPTARSAPSVGVIAGKLYAVGGESDTPYEATNEEFEPAANAWRAKAAMPTARRDLAAGVVGAVLYAVGGYNVSNLTSNEEYDPAANTWVGKAVLPTARRNLAAGTVAGKLYAVGGLSGSALPTNEEYDPAANVWTARAAMPTARFGMRAGVVGGKLLAAGGYDTAFSVTNEEYDPTANAWIAKAPMPTARMNFAGAAIGGKFYAAGGFNGSVMAVTEEYDPGTATLFTGLSPNTQYSFKAKARNQGGVETDETATVSTYTLAAVPGTPSFAAVGTGTLTLQWTVNGNPGGTEFQAELSSAAAFSPVTLAGWTADMTSAVFSGLPSGTTWYGRVRSRNAAGVPSDYASAASTRTAYASPAGCAVTRDVGKSGAPYGTITAALAAVPTALTAETCVVVRDTATYVEQVTVSSRTTNGFRLRILGDPELAFGPTVAPPAFSTAAFRVQSASVSLEGLRVVPGFPLMYGVEISTLYARLQRVLVLSTVAFGNAGVGLDSFGLVENSTVSVGASRGVWSSVPTQVENTVRASSVTNASPSFHAVWFVGRRNSLVDSFARNSAGTAVALGVECRLEGSTATSAGTSVVTTAANASTVTIVRSMIESAAATFGLIINGGEGHSVSETTVTVSGAALSLTGVTRSTLSRVHVYSSGGTGLQMTSGSAWNVIAFSTIVTGAPSSYAALSVISSSNSLITGSVVRSPDSGALYLEASRGISVVASTLAGRGSLGAAYLHSSSLNILADDYIHSPTDSAVELRSGSNGNAFRRSRLVSGAAAGYALHLTSSSSNVVTDSLVENTTGYAAFFAVKADGNSIDLSTVTARASGYSALYLDNASTNTFTRSYFGNAAGNAVTFGAGASSNTLSLSTVASSGAAARALSLFMALDSYVYDSWLLGAGYGAYAELSARALILRSTVAGLGAVPGFVVAGSSGVVLRDSYAQGGDAVNVYSSTATAVENSTLKATGGSGKALQFLQGSNGLSLASATLSAAAVGLLIEDGSRGPLALSSFSVTASTGLRFTGGTQVATVSLAGFPAGTAVNVDASGLSSASRVTMRDANGGRAGTLHETDPLGLVDWLPDENPVLLPGPFSAVSSNSLTASWTSGYPAGTLYYARTSTDSAFAGTVFSSDTFALSASFGGLGTLTTYYARVATSAAGPFTALGSTRTRFGDLPGCATSKFVQKSGGADCASIGACVALVPSTPLTGDYCIAVLDSAVYSEQVTVAGKDPNGFRIRLWGAGGARPTVTPPAGSSAGFRLLTAGVSVSDINVVTTNTVTYGVLASSASVSVSSMIVDSGGRISGAGVFLSSWGAVHNASVTVQNADGFRLTGTGNVISASSASVTVFGRAAYYLGTASSNTISDSYGSGNPGYGAFVYHSHGNTFARTTLRKLSASAGAAGLYLNDASSNTVTGCFISNAGGPGADLSSSVDYNLIELSTITAAGDVYTALELGFAKGNRISRVYVHSDNGSGSTLSSGASETLVENSTFSTSYSGAAALSTNGSSDTLTGNMLYAPNGIGLGVFGSSVTTRRNAAFTGSPSFAALHVAGGGYVSVHDSSFENSAGDGGKLERTSYVDILRSTVAGAGGGAGLKLEGSSSNTVTASRLAAPGGVGMALGSYLELFDMTTTTGTGNVLRDLIVFGSTAVSLGAAPGLELSSSVLTGDAQGAAIAFGDAVLVATFTGLTFPSGSAVSAAATLLPSGSRITIRDASGPQAGSLYEFDPLSLVDWVPDLVPFVLPPAPEAPSGTVLGASSIAWTWGPVAGAQSYRVYSSSSGSLLAASASTGVVVTDLLAATTNSIVVAGVARGENGPLSASATAHTHASPPAGLSLDILYVSSAVLSWSLEDNPSETLAELQRSTDGASYSVRAGTLAPSAEDTGLLGCTSYYYRVRHKSPAGVGSAFDGPLLVRTAASTPSAPGDLSAQSVPGRRVALTWSGSLTEGVVAYRLYKDSGAGSVDYSAPYATFGPTTFSTTTVALSSGAIHLFGLRALHRCGVEEANTHAVASAWALETLDGVRASIKVPATGKKISGNRVLVMAELDTGSSSDVSSILFQYRSTGTAAWTDIPAANVNHPNPDREQPFFVHWDVSALADRAYDLRAVASDVVGASDPAPGTITVLVDSVGFEVRETDLGAGRVKKEQAVSNETSNTVAAAGSGSAVVTKVILPAGALNTADATLSATPNPAALPAPPAAATSLGASIEITLSNGQSQLSNGQTAAIVFNYPDDDGDGIIDGTSVRAENAEIQVFDVPTNKWKKEFATSVDRDKKTLTGFTPHFSLFAAFGVVTTGLDQIRVYPNPYKPNAGNPDEGRTFSRADPLSGVVFDNLPAVVDIKIYTLTGRLVSSFGTNAGTGAVQWDGKNDNGEDVASGGYFAVITSPGQTTVIKKLAVIR